MDQTEHSSPSGNVDTKPAFRKPSNDAANRKYRRRSPVDGSPSSDGSPENGRRPSLIPSREDSGKESEHHQGKRDNKQELDRDTGRDHHGRSTDSYKHDRQTSKSSHRYSKHEDYSRHERHADEGGRKYQMSPTRYSKDSRGGHHSDYRRQEAEHGRLRDYTDRYSRDKSGSGYRSHDKEKDVDPSTVRAGSGRRHADSRFEGKEKEQHARDRDRSDEKKELHRSLGDHQSDRSHARDERRKYVDSETKKEMGFSFKAPKDRSEGKSVSGNQDKEAPAKKLKLFSSEKFTIGENAEEKHSTSLKPAVVPGISGDVDAAKVAAMKAAELVNKNLVGTGYLTADQKKKLLWGNKKSTVVEEPAVHRWDNALVGDPDRQEKFNKLMGVKGNLKTEQKQNNNPDIQAEKQMELQADLEKQYTAGLRRRDGRTVGLGL